MKDFSEFINEYANAKLSSFGQTPFGESEVVIGGQKYKIVFAYKDGKTISSLDSPSMQRITAFDGKLSIRDATVAITEYLDKVGHVKVKTVFDKTISTDEVNKTNTDWEVYSEYVNVRNRVVIRILSKMQGGKRIFKEDDSINRYLYIGLKYRAEEAELIEKMKIISKHHKVKHASGAVLI